jgi:hypothetical protein
LALDQRGGRLIGHTDIMMIIRPINADIQHTYNLSPSQDLRSQGAHRKTGHGDSLIWVVVNTVLWIIRCQSLPERGASL